MENNKAPLFTGASLILLEDCNLACSYCYTLAEREKGKNMSLDTALKTVDTLVNNALASDTREVTLIFFGGEPMLAFDTLVATFKYAADLCRQCDLDFRPTIITNCTFIPKGFDDFLQYWITSGYRVNMQLSIDGCAYVQNLNRTFCDGSGSHSIVHDTAKSYVELFTSLGLTVGSNLHVHSVVSKASLPFMYESYKYFRSLGFPGVWNILLPEADWNSEDIEVYREQLTQIHERILSDCIADNTSMYMATYSSAAKCQSSVHPQAPCGAGKSFMTVVGNGDIYPCHKFYFNQKSFPLGNVFSSELNVSERQLFLDYGSVNMFGDTFCKDCKSTGCYRCIATNYSYNGNILLGFPKYCSMTKVEQTLSQQLIAKLRDNGILKNSKEAGSNSSTYSVDEVADLINGFTDTIDSYTKKLQDIDEKLLVILDFVTRVTAIVAEEAK